ncbi:MAG: hypothetical protein AABW90_03720 [Nanoarchaeota archaeon]
MATNKNLECKLRAIQELKREKYIGTKEAWNYLDRVNALYENPKIIANSINENLSRDGEVYYKATPEIIMGFERPLDILPYGNLSSKDIGYLPLFCYYEYISGNSKNRNLEKIANYLYPIFKDVQRPDITNSLFGLSAIEYSLDNLNVHCEKKEKIFKKFVDYDWDYCFSSENLRNIEKELKLEIYFDEVSIVSRIERMERDLVDHRLENRREILCDYLSSLSRFYKENELDYASLREILLKRLENREKQLKRLGSIVIADVVKNNQEKLVDETKFLLTAIAPERNFIDKYLKS